MTYLTLLRVGYILDLPIPGSFGGGGAHSLTCTFQPATLFYILLPIIQKP